MRNTPLVTGVLSILTSSLLFGCGPAAATGQPTTADKITAADSGEDSGSEETGDSGDHGQISDFALKDVDGRTHALSDYLGDKVIVISFWATWCEPCKKEMGQLQALYDQHKDKGLMMISISMDEPETQGDVRPYVKQRGFTYPILIDEESQVTAQLNPRNAAPLTLIIDRSGKIVWQHESYVPGDEEKLEKAVLKTLGIAAE